MYSIMIEPVRSEGQSAAADAYAQYAFFFEVLLAPPT